MSISLLSASWKCSRPRGKRKRGRTMASNPSKPQITPDSSYITLPINQIALTDEQLKLALSEVYETGHSHARKFRLCNLSSILLSIAGTLFLTCLTSRFNDFFEYVGFHTHKPLTGIAWSIFAFTFVGGLILHSLGKEVDMSSQRDAVVNNILGRLKKQ